ncbi:hypothetical protein [Nonomuraea sp. NPDC049480]|uniref:hypothetical protein n=1 Tax=Nonomuraea sp. NPDC049480 TaxID=3364353 RepID=UPI0037954046
MQRLISISDTLGSPLAARASACWNAAVTAYRHGRSADALVLAERALALFGETDHARDLAMLRAGYGLVLLDGDPAEPERAHEILLDARHRFTRLGTPR